MQFASGAIYVASGVSVRSYFVGSRSIYIEGQHEEIAYNGTFGHIILTSIESISFVYKFSVGSAQHKPENSIKCMRFEGWSVRSHREASNFSY